MNRVGAWRQRKVDELRTIQCTRCGETRDAATVVMHLATEVRHETVWVGPHVVQLGPEWLPGGMPHRIDPGYWKPVSHTVVLAVLANGARIPARSSMAGWSTGTQVCMPCRDARVRQRSLLQQSLTQLPARKRPVAPTAPSYAAIRGRIPRSSVVGWSLLWFLICLGISLSSPIDGDGGAVRLLSDQLTNARTIELDVRDAIEAVASDLRGALTYYGFSQYDTYAALALQALLLGWPTALAATWIRRRKAYDAAMAAYRKQRRAYAKADSEAIDYEARRAGVISALAKLDADMEGCFVKLDQRLGA